MGQRLQARNRKNFLKHIPNNKINESVMQTLTTGQTSLGKCTVSPGHSLLAHTSDPLLCLSAHKEKAMHVNGGSDKKQT